ncbi:succinate dehydrogenase assembly factor 2 [Rhodoplanes sp. TEM]|uniref:FAD assembly factor SdhE n=1 Tax=Rhodoplanes tepidamans TaxID=200616 RepID=A0ABT5JI24_RHOTP|nr:MULTISPECIES: succinate dehydrogenase assembly factor 2 [Rhodoplanes]MDC7789242.1 succinate dehydrogenase assembly factor 2 [Rhodoplanes tepidamans]MDC7985820.1 succinate dehydrogenase assembly factor 2 [Rhodoplanes sp. TEM]MDQ0358853.1 antitoxin CptB [Rhodoplanes tepidamans]
MTGTTRSSAGLSERRRRLLFRAWRRGTRELDLLTGRFADAVIADLTEAEMTEFEGWCSAPDLDLYAWITGSKPVPPEYDTPLFRRLKAFDHGAAAV